MYQYVCGCFCFAVESENKTTHFSFACFNLAMLDLTSRRKRGLSGMKMTPTSAASAGKRHTRINNLQLWIWNSVPMAKPQPRKTSSKERVNISRTHLSGMF